MNRRGFTLFELTIVLIIIGLVIGGIVVGRDLVAASYIRATVTQIENYKTAVAAFRGKYNGLPGDLTSSLATQVGMTARTGAAGHGDGNNILEGCSAAAVATATIAGCETMLFWNDLTLANMIEGKFVGADVSTYNLASLEGNGFNLISVAMAAKVITDKDSLLPTAKIKNGNYIIVYSDTGVNYFELTGLTSTSSGIYTLYNALTPMEAFNIDQKTDDGDPMAGRIEATEGTGPDNLAVPGVATCIFSANEQYNEALTTRLCHLRVRMQ